MSLKTIPGFGKSGTSRIARRRSSATRVASVAALDTLSHNGKRSRKVVEPCERKLGDMLDVRAGRAGPRRGLERRDRGIGSRCRDLDAAVVTVTDPSRQPGATSRFPHEPSEADALYSADDFEMNRRHPSSAAVRPSKERREHRCQHSRVGRFGRNGRDVNLAASHALRQPIERG